MKQIQAALTSLLLLSVPLWAQSSADRVQTDITNSQQTARRTSVKIAHTGKVNVRQMQKVTPNSTATNFPFRRKPDLKKPVFPQLAAFQNPVNVNNLVNPGLPIVGPSGFGFDALDTRDSALVTGFVEEPPDQALGVSSTQELEGVNDALAVFSPSGSRIAGPVSFETFFHVPPPTATRLPEVSDPRVFFDWSTQRWIVIILEFARNPKTLAILPGSQVLLAVSDSSDAAGSYDEYIIDVSDNSFPGCPCLGDQPLLGVNQDGVFLSMNEFASSTLSFQTVLIVALDKAALVAGSSTVHEVAFDDLTQAEGPGFSVQPAVPAPNTSTSQNNGTEYFVSSLDFTGTVDNRLTIWALTNTRSLPRGGSGIGLHERTIVSEEYGQPPPAVQKPGPTPLGRLVGEPEELLDTGDDRVQQLYFTNGKLVTGFNTVVLSNNGSAPRTGIAWFQLTPTASLVAVSASITKQGYVAAQRESVFYPSASLSGAGKGVIGFSLSGPDFFPSTAFVFFNNATVGSAIHIQGQGSAPEDGFSGYVAFGGAGVARWGDYSASVISPAGHTWFAAEYITPRQRTKFTNWGTFIARPQ